MSKVSTQNLRGLSLFLREQTIDREQGLHAVFAGKFANMPQGVAVYIALSIARSHFSV